MSRIVITGLLALLLLAGFRGSSPAEAAAAVRVKWLDCAQHPAQLDTIFIENQGDAAQDLAGWELRSDFDNERMPLAPAGILGPDKEIVAAAGAHAVNLPDEGVYLWSNNEILRDAGDPPDFVKLFDSSGSMVSGMDCNHQELAPPATTPAPAAPEPTPAPTLAPVAQAAGGTAGGTRTTPAPAVSINASSSAGSGAAAPDPGVVPESGGPPGVSGDPAALWLSAGTLMALAGAAMFGSGMVTVPASARASGRRLEGSRRCGD